MRALSRGFTLVELIVVMLLVAVIGAVATTRWSASDATAPYQAYALARDLEHMQMLAMSWDQSLRLSVPAGGNSYSIVCSSGSATAPCAGAGAITNPATSAAYSVTLQDGVTLPGPASVDIDHLGHPVSSAGALLNADQVFVLTGGGQTWSVRLKPVTGFVAVTTP